MEKLEKVDNVASLVDNKAIEHSDCEECNENYIFKLRDNEHEFYIGLTTILSCLAFAQAEGAVPEIDEDWWINIRNAY